MAKQKIKVAFQGDHGAYSEKAAGLFVGKNVLALPQPRFEDVFLAVTRGRVNFGVLPFENALTGSIHENYDLLIKHKVWIVGEEVLAIRHHLIGVPGSSLRKVREVFSHPQGLMQCGQFLSGYKPDGKKRVRQTPFFDTAGAVRHVLEAGDPSLAAIAGRHAAEHYGLKVLKTRIGDNKANFTPLSAHSKASSQVAQGGHDLMQNIDRS